jgi:hypothetical protein
VCGTHVRVWHTCAFVEQINIHNRGSAHLEHLPHVQPQAGAGGGGALLPDLAPHRRRVAVLVKLRSRGRKQGGGCKWGW